MTTATPASARSSRQSPSSSRRFRTGGSAGASCSSLLSRSSPRASANVTRAGAAEALGVTPERARREGVRAVSGGGRDIAPHYRPAPRPPRMTYSGEGRTNEQRQQLPAARHAVPLVELLDVDVDGVAAAAEAGGDLLFAVPGQPPVAR